MKVYAIRDKALMSSGDLAWLIYYEKYDRFCIELSRNTDEWILPPILSSFRKKNKLTLDFHWSRIWVESRIVPPDRQNLGMILKRNGLDYYNPYALLLLTGGCCAQDDCFIVPLKAGAYPEELTLRLQEKIRELIYVSGNRTHLVFCDGRILTFEPGAADAFSGRSRRLLEYYHNFSECRVSPGGQAVEWTDEQYIPADELRKSLAAKPFTEEDLFAYVRKNLVSTGEVTEILKCSRQNVGDLVKRGKLKPVREEKNNSLFLRSDVLQRADLQRAEG